LAATGAVFAFIGDESSREQGELSQCSKYDDITINIAQVLLLFFYFFIFIIILLRRRNYEIACIADCIEKVESK